MQDHATQLSSLTASSLHSDSCFCNLWTSKTSPQWEQRWYRAPAMLPQSKAASKTWESELNSQPPWTMLNSTAAQHVSHAGQTALTHPSPSRPDPCSFLYLSLCLCEPVGLWDFHPRFAECTFWWGCGTALIWKFGGLFWAKTEQQCCTWAGCTSKTFRKWNMKPAQISMFDKTMWSSLLSIWRSLHHRGHVFASHSHPLQRFKLQRHAETKNLSVQHLCRMQHELWVSLHGTIDGRWNQTLLWHAQPPIRPIHQIYIKFIQVSILMNCCVCARGWSPVDKKDNPPSTRMATSILQTHTLICPNNIHNIQQADMQQHWVQTFANGRWKPGTQKPSHCYPTRPVDVKLWSCWTVQQRAKHKLRDRSQVIPHEKCNEKHNILMNPVISPKYTEVLQIPHLL